MHRFFLFFLISIFCLNLSAQKSINNPFSSYGLGEMFKINHGSFSALGGNYVMQADSLNLNHFNPSSYCNLGNGQPIFTFNTVVKFSNFSEGQQKYSNTNFGISDFAIGIPFFKKMGVAFGVRPFSSKGYDFISDELVNKDTVRSKYSGDGNINQSFIGYSIKVLNSKKHKLALGSNLSYVFGSVNDKRLSYISTQTTGGASTKTIQTKSLFYDFGVNYSLAFKHNRSIQLGLVFTPSQQLTSFYTNELYSVFDIENERSYNILSTEYNKGTYTTPSQISAGFSYTYRPIIDSNFNKTKIPQIRFLAQFVNTSWSNFQNNLNHQSTNVYSNTSSFSVGVEYTANYNYLERSKNSNYLSKIKYRIGYQYANLPILHNSKQINNTDLTFGFSLPIIIQRSVSSFNVGVAYGKNGNGIQSNLNEKYFGINFGVNIAPGSYDRWFRKYKID